MSNLTVREDRPGSWMWIGPVEGVAASLFAAAAMRIDRLAIRSDLADAAERFAGPIEGAVWFRPDSRPIDSVRLDAVIARYGQGVIREVIGPMVSPFYRHADRRLAAVNVPLRDAARRLGWSTPTRHEDGLTAVVTEDAAAAEALLDAAEVADRTAVWIRTSDPDATRAVRGIHRTVVDGGTCWVVRETGVSVPKAFSVDLFPREDQDRDADRSPVTTRFPFAADDARPLAA